MLALQLALAQGVGFEQRGDLIGRHLPGNHEFAQCCAIVGRLALLIDPYQPAREAMSQQGGDGGAAGGTSANHHKTAGIAVPGRFACRQGLVIDPDFIALDPRLVAAQVGQRRRFTDHAIVNGERSFVPRANQQTAANHAFIKGGACVGAIALVGVYLIALANEDEFFVAGLDAQGAVLVELGQAGHGVLGHGGFSKGAFGTI